MDITELNLELGNKEDKTTHFICQLNGRRGQCGAIRKFTMAMIAPWGQCHMHMGN